MKRPKRVGVLSERERIGLETLIDSPAVSAPSLINETERAVLLAAARRLVQRNRGRAGAYAHGERRAAEVLREWAREIPR